MHRNFFRAAIVLVFSAVSACSLFVSLDDLSDGGNGNDASTLDAASDANISDSSTTDSPITLADSGDAGVCNGFCDDFDDRTTIAGDWDNIASTGNGQSTDLSISSAEFVSSPHSLHARIPARASGSTNDRANLNKNLPLTAGSMSIDFDLKILGSQTGLDGYANLMELSVVGDYAGSVTWNGAGTTVVDYWVNFADGGHNQPLYDLGQTDSAWHHFHYAVKYDPDNGSVLVTRDGATIANVTGANTFGTGSVPSAFNFAIGYSDFPAVAALDVYFDNVQVQ